MRANERFAVRAVNVVLALVAAVLLVAHVRVSDAETFSPPFHWHNGTVEWGWEPGFKDYEAPSENALNDWKNGTVVNFRETSNPKMPLKVADWGATGWSGLAYLNGSIPSGHGYADLSHCRIDINKHHVEEHRGFIFEGPFARGVMCQEIGHCLGLAHSNDGCMGLTYYWGNLSWTPNRKNYDEVNSLHR